MVPKQKQNHFKSLWNTSSKDPQLWPKFEILLRLLASTPELQPFKIALTFDPACSPWKLNPDELHLILEGCYHNRWIWTPLGARLDLNGRVLSRALSDLPEVLNGCPFKIRFLPLVDEE